MQSGPVLLDRQDFSEVGGIVLDGPRFCRGDLAAFVTAHRCQRGQDDLVGTLTSGGSELKELVSGAGLDLDW
jgi:hypothetical protein